MKMAVTAYIYLIFVLVASAVVVASFLLSLPCLYWPEFRSNSSFFKLQKPIRHCEHA